MLVCGYCEQRLVGFLKTFYRETGSTTKSISWLSFSCSLIYSWASAPYIWCRTVSTVMKAKKTKNKANERIKDCTEKQQIMYNIPTCIVVKKQHAWLHIYAQLRSARTIYACKSTWLYNTFIYLSPETMVRENYIYPICAECNCT